MILKEFLENKKCFKLVCGAGNENLDEVEKLVAIYAKAGCRLFDLSPHKKVIEAAQKGLLRVIDKKKLSDYYFCISVGIKGEPHFNKAKINQKFCKQCGNCIDVCLQNAICLKSRLGFPAQQLEVAEEKCIGCAKCLKICQHNAIEIYQKNKPINELLENILNCSPFQPFSLSAIELHASGIDEKDVEEKWNYLNKNFEGMLSLCIDRSKLSNQAVINRIKNLIKNRNPYTTLIQADGNPMSGGEDDFKTTLPAVAMAEIVANEKLPVYLLISGGTNTKTARLAKKFGIDFNGISVGSYARKIVKNYIEKEDFWSDKKSFNKAVSEAKKLISSTF